MIEQVERLRAALAAEHAAIYAYGRLGVLLEKEIRPVAHEAEAAHRARRDALIIHLADVKAQPVEADAAYALPFAVTDRESALRLAIQVEDKVTATWRSALAGTEGDARRITLDGFADAAVRATRWRKIAGVTPLTSTFPGRAS